MRTRDFFQKIKPWSKRKHRLLSKYLRPFSAKVAKTTTDREIYCIDGFAGGAKYDDGTEGSPLLIARFSDECARWANPVLLRLINVEPDKDNEGIFESLEAATKPWVERDVVLNIRSEFHSALPCILKTINSRPALFFIDPLLPTQVTFSHLEPVLKRRAVTELIINFDTDGLHRIARAAVSPNTNPKVAETDLNLVNSIVGSSNWLQRFRTENLSTEDGEGQLLHEYIDNIRIHDYEVVAYKIRESLTSRPQYHFVYCTRHRDGVALMNDFLREEEDLLYGEHVEHRLPLFSEEAAIDAVIDERRHTLRVILELFLAQNASITRGEIKHRLIPVNFGQFHCKHYNSVIQDLLDERILRAQTGKKRINDNDLLFYHPI